MHNNKLLIKSCHKTNNKKLTSTPPTMFNTRYYRNAAATNLTATISSLLTSTSVITTLTTTTRHHCHHQPDRPSSFAYCRRMFLQKYFLCIVLLLQYSSVLAGSCREAQLCCNGRDSSCVVQKAPINAIIEDLSDKPCYCDHACLKLGDCCSDFKDHCGVLDCQVSEWEQWTVCNTACGSGTMSRSRQVLQPAQNGGKHCPVLLQKRGCQGFRCHGHHDKKLLRETALLLPASLTHNHHANNDSRVRRNLKAHFRETYQHNREQEYCVEFEVLRTSKSCHKLPPYNLMIEGDRIVVSCDVEAFVQDFISSKDENLTISTLKFQQHNDTLYNKNDLNNMSNEEDLNDSEENIIDNSSSSSSDEHDDYDTASLTVKTTTTTTTTTSTTPYPPLQTIQYHCRGEGLPGRTTRWNALAAPSCRGKWLRLTLDTPRKCSHSQFIFV